MTLTLYDLLGPYATPDGLVTPLGTTSCVWSYTGTATPYPAAPVAYDGTVDFTGYSPDPGYQYTYTVSLGAKNVIAVVDINLNDYLTLLNDLCAGAFAIQFPMTPGARGEITNQDNNGDCPGVGLPTDSGEAIPAAWGAGPFTGDLWYKFNVPAGASSEDISFTVSSSSYSVAERGSDFYVALYDGSCVSLNELDTAVPPFPGAVYAQIPNYLFTNAGPSAVTYWLRVVTESTTGGKFTVTITHN